MIASKHDPRQTEGRTQNRFNVLLDGTSCSIAVLCVVEWYSNSDHDSKEKGDA